MRSIIWLTFAALVGSVGPAVAADGPFGAEVLKQAFELSKTCAKECANDSFNMERLPLAQGKIGFLITTRDMGFCGSGGCSSMVVVVSGSKAQKITEGLGITKNQAISFVAGDIDPNNSAGAQASFDCTKAKSASARLICGDPDLAKADRALGTKFKAAADKDQATRKQLIEQQVGWIRGRNSRCGVGPDKAKVPLEQLLSSKSCMLEAINARIAELGGTAPDAPLQANAPSKSGRSAALAALRRQYGEELVVRGGGGVEGYALFIWTNAASNTGGETVLKRDNATSEWTIVDTDKAGLDTQRLLSKGVPQAVATQLTSRGRPAEASAANPTSQPPPTAAAAQTDDGDPTGLFGVKIGMDGEAAARTAIKRFNTMGATRIVHEIYGAAGGGGPLVWSSLGPDASGNATVIAFGPQVPTPGVLNDGTIGRLQFKFAGGLQNARAAVQEVFLFFQRIERSAVQQQISEKFGQPVRIANTPCFQWRRDTEIVKACETVDVGVAIGNLEINYSDPVFVTASANARAQRQGGVARPKM